MAVAPAGDGEERKPTDAEASLSGEGTPLPEAAQRRGTDRAALMAEEAVLMAEEEAQALAHGLPDLRGLRTATLIRYSTSSHPLQAAVVRCLRLVASGTEEGDTALLETLHTLPVSAQAARRRRGAGALLTLTLALTLTLTLTLTLNLPLTVPERQVRC